MFVPYGKDIAREVACKEWCPMLFVHHFSIDEDEVKKKAR
jgi:hypothetical protein